MTLTTLYAVRPQPLDCGDEALAVHHAVQHHPSVHHIDGDGGGIQVQRAVQDVLAEYRKTPENARVH